MNYMHKCPMCGEEWGHESCMEATLGSANCPPCHESEGFQPYDNGGMEWDYKDSFKHWVTTIRTAAGL